MNLHNFEVILQQPVFMEADTPPLIITQPTFPFHLEHQFESKEK